jgi:hypothetical protein
LPDALLKSRTAHIERQIEADCRGLDEADHPGHQMLEVLVTANELCFWKAVLEVAHQRLGVVAQQNGTDAPGSGRNQDRAQ